MFMSHFPVSVSVTVQLTSMARSVKQLQVNISCPILSPAGKSVFILCSLTSACLFSLSLHL